MLNILLITIICTIVIDLTDFFQTVDKALWNWVFNNNKPYNGWRFKITSCSLCASWWCSLLYLLITHSLSFPLLTYALFLAFMTPVIKDYILLVKDLFIKILNYIYKVLKIDL